MREGSVYMFEVGWCSVELVL